MIHVDIRFKVADALGRSHFEFTTSPEIAANVSAALNAAQDSGNDFVSFQIINDEWIIIRRDNINAVLITPANDGHGRSS